MQEALLCIMYFAWTGFVRCLTPLQLHARETLQAAPGRKMFAMSVRTASVPILYSLIPLHYIRSALSTVSGHVQIVMRDAGYGYACDEGTVIRRYQSPNPEYGCV